MRKINLMVASALMLTLNSCEDEKTTDQNPQAAEKFFIAASQGEGTYLFTVDDAGENITTTTETAIENPVSYTHYAYNGNTAVLGLAYRQGDPAVGVVYGLDNAGNLVEKGNGFELTDGFSTLGPVGNYIVTSRSGRTLTDGGTGSLFYFIDLANNNYISQKAINTENFAGTDLTANFIGIAEAGEGEFFTGVEFPDGSVDSVYVAKFDTDLNMIKFYQDDRLSRSGGQYRSARYSQIGNDDKGNTYVFSGSYSTETVKPAGALRINKGADDFDSYYFNIEAKSSGYRFRKVWHITADYFLLEFYNDLEYSSQTPATQYAVVGMEGQSFSWVQGIPAKDNIESTGWPYATDGKAYLPITAADGQPAIYVIDPVTATATKGITVNGAESISGIAKLVNEL